jgi:hypothetical protein
MQPDLPPFEWEEQPAIPVPEAKELPPVFGWLQWDIATEEQDRHEGELRCAT